MIFEHDGLVGGRRSLDELETDAHTTFFTGLKLLPFLHKHSMRKTVARVNHPIDPTLGAYLAREQNFPSSRIVLPATRPTIIEGHFRPPTFESRRSGGFVS